MKRIILALIVINLVSIDLKSQTEQQLSVSVNTIPSWYINKNLSLLDLYRFKGDKAKEFTNLLNLNIDYQINKTIGLQLGVQYYELKLENKDFTYEFESGGFNDPYWEDYNYGIEITRPLFETPIGLIIRKEINSKLDVDFIFSSSIIFRFSDKYEINNKLTGEVEAFSLGRNWRIYSKYSPQIKIRFNYQVIERLNVLIGCLYKMEKISSFDKVYLGGLVGVSYQIK